MLRYKTVILTALLLTLCVCLPDSAVALSTGQAASARSALKYAERGKWDDALAHANRVGDPAFYDLITMRYLMDTNSGAPFNAYVKFIESHGDWPDISRLRVRAELALNSSSVRDHDLIAWFSDSAPITGIGKIALVEAYQRNKFASQEKLAYLVRDAWRNGDYEGDQEKDILKTYGKWLTVDDHIGRIDRLLWEGKTSAAKRVLGKVPDKQEKLFLARISLIDNRHDADSRLRQVSTSLLRDPGLIYDRMQYRLRRDNTAGVREMLLQAPSHVPYPEKWWRAREYQVHKAINEKNYDLAYKLLENHGQVDGAPLADANWLKGWILSEFLRRPKEGYHVFYDMFESVNYPVSKARAAYWAGRAAERAGDRQASKSWYNTASSYPTTYYGQIASHKINGTAPLHIPAPPSISSGDRRHFDNSSLLKAIRICIELGEKDTASWLINHMTENVRSEGVARLAAELGRQLGNDYLSVRAAKKALQRNIVLTEAGYPTPKTPSGIGIERPLALAIMRQESEYDPKAKSPAGAMGLMQLMSRTAKDVARKEKITYSGHRLYEPDYNMRLGSAYLSRMIESYDGSYVMAIAAYNAGPGNVRVWSRQFGTPGNDMDSAINWVERIPYAETRNYVQRVLENLQVYRYLESEKGTPNLQIAQDLIR